MTSRFYYALWNGELGFERAQEFTSYPQLGPLQFPDDNAEEALSVYDHPRVILWKKSPNYSSAKRRAKFWKPCPYRQRATGNRARRGKGASGR